MKATLVAGFIFALFVSALSVRSPQVRLEISDARFSTSDGIVYLDGVRFSGIQFEKYPNGQMYRESNFEAGLRHGKTREFHFQNRPKAVFNYRHGLKHGEQMHWFAEGPKQLQENFVAGVLHGETTEWHLNGKVFRQIMYANGVETARKILYANNNNIYSNYATRGDRNYGIDGGELCMPVKPEGAR